MRDNKSILTDVINKVYSVKEDDSNGVRKIHDAVVPIIKRSNIRINSKSKILFTMKKFEHTNDVLGLQKYLTNSMFAKMGLGNSNFSHCS